MINYNKCGHPKHARLKHPATNIKWHCKYCGYIEVKTKASKK